MRLIIVLILLVFSSCDFRENKNTFDHKTPAKYKVTGIEFTTIGQVKYMDPDTVNKPPDEMVFSIVQQDIPGMFGITADGYLHIGNPELLESGVFNVLVKAQEVNTLEKYYDEAWQTIKVVLNDTTSGLPNCDTIIYRIDSTWIPPVEGYWSKDTTYLRLVASCWDTIPL